MDIDTTSSDDQNQNYSTDSVWSDDGSINLKRKDARLKYSVLRNNNEFVELKNAFKRTLKTFYWMNSEKFKRHMFSFRT